MRITSDNRIESSGRGLWGLIMAWDGLRILLTVEIPRLLAALARLRP